MRPARLGGQASRRSGAKSGSARYTLPCPNPASTAAGRLRMEPNVSQPDAHALARSLAEQGVLYVMGSFIDVLGRAKGKVVPVDHLPNLLRGSERYTPRGLGDLGQMNPEEDEVVALP